MRTWFYTFVVGAAAGLTACSFDADYGGTQLRCPPTSPRCPDGYTCVNEMCAMGGATDSGVDGVTADAGACDLAIGEGTRDTCGQARDLTPAANMTGGTMVYGNTMGYANDLTPSTLPNCTSSPEPGPDAIWRVSITAGQTLSVTFAPEGWSGDVYVINACSSTATCMGGGAMFTPVTLTPAAGTYYIVVDSRSAGANGCFALDVEITP